MTLPAQDILWRFGFGWKECGGKAVTQGKNIHMPEKIFKATAAFGLDL